jgi:hypothetical protein
MLLASLEYINTGTIAQIPDPAPTTAAQGGRLAGAFFVLFYTWPLK